MASADQTAPLAPKPSLRDRHQAETRQRIVDVALDLFVAQGFEATTVDEIADGADVSPRTFFRYFPTKEAVLFHDLDERLARMHEQLAARPPEEPAPLALVEVLCSMVEEVESTPAQRSLMVTLLNERPSMRSYQRTAIAESAEAQVTSALASRSGADTDLALRAMVAAVAACFDIALRDWTTGADERPFDEMFLDTLEACGQAFPRQRLRRSQPVSSRKK